jgi:hypothetical protein
VADVEDCEDGAVDWSPPMFGQLLDDFAAVFDCMAAAGEVDVAAGPDELLAACATAPPASAAVAARVTINLR